MAGSGNRRMLLNQRERVVSADHNRLQAFLSRDVVEVLRFLLDATLLHDEESEGVETVGATTTDPLRGTILNGIRFRPGTGTADAFVEPGVACVVNPDAVPDADDSPYKFIVDPGVPSAGTLSLTAGGGSTRIDVVECQRVDTLLESASRDVFNPSTGLFSAQSVEKSRAGRLSYRIRTGTAGAGFPGTASGWLPIAVCSVPAAAANWDVVDVYDVRPLVADLWRPPLQASAAMQRNWKAWGYDDTAPILLKGVAEATFGARKAGGMWPNAGIDVSTITTAFHETGFAFSVNGYYVWAAFPHGLPRWCKYTTVADGGARRPSRFRGIVVISNKGPATMTGNSPTSALVMPTGTGLTASSNTSNAALVFAGASTGAAAQPYIADGDHIFFAAGAQTIAPASTSANTSADYDLTDNVHHPANARAVWVRLDVTITSTGAGQVSLASEARPLAAGSNLTIIKYPNIFLDFDGAGEVFTHQATFRVPISPNYPFAHTSAPFTRVVRHVFNGGAHTASAHGLTVLGWELGP